MKIPLLILFILLGLVGVGGVCLFLCPSAPHEARAFQYAPGIVVQPSSIKSPAFPAASTLLEPEASVQPTPSSLLPEESLRHLINNPGELRLTMDQVTNYLRQNSGSAEACLAVYQLSGSLHLLREAANRFPDDPRLKLQLALATGDALERREALMAIRACDPENALPDYLIALDHLRTGSVDAALDYLATGTDKTYFDDYAVSVMQSAEEAYLSAGFNPMRAKVAMMAGLQRQHLGPMRELSNELEKLQVHYKQAGDHASADAVSQMGLEMGRRMHTDAIFYLDELVGASIEKQFLALRDPSESATRLAEIESRVNAIRGVISTPSLMQMDSIETIIYMDRVKLYSEDAALKWLRTRRDMD